MLTLWSQTTILTFAEWIRRGNIEQGIPARRAGSKAGKGEIEERVFDWYIMKEENIWQLHSMLGIEKDKW